MSEELGKIEKPLVEEFKKGRKLYFVPLIYCGKEPEPDYLEKFNKYWNQVETQMSDLELKLGQVEKIYHELVPLGGDDGIKAIKELNDKSYEIIESRLGGRAQLKATEETALLMKTINNPMRSIRNRLAEEVLAVEEKGATFEEIMVKVAGQRTKSSYLEGDPEDSMLPCGQVVGLIDEMKTVSQVIDDIISEAVDMLKRLNMMST